MHGTEILLISLLATFAQGTNASRFPNWQSSWIQGGSDADPAEFPYMVSVRYRRKNITSFCGGSIINNWYVLTAAHCVSSATIAMVKVVTGTIKLHGGGQIYDLSRIIIHESFHQDMVNNDIALLRTASPIAYRKTVRPVTLPNKRETAAPGMGCIFVGWGRTSKTSSLSSYLQKLQLTIISNQECKKHYRLIFHTKICATAHSGKGSCIGDSGGPLMCGGKQMGVQIGGGRKGTVCSTPLPVQFMYVPEYLDWIKKHTV